jgi:hypothetical protein
MRALLLVILVACGPAQTSPQPVSNQPTGPMVATPPPPPANALPSCTDSNMKCAMQHMEYFSVRMCNCKDKPCAEGTNEAMTKWGTDMAKRADRNVSEKPDPAFAKHAADVMTRYTECMTKLYTEGTPPPDPCGGGGDPCGG